MGIPSKTLSAAQRAACRGQMPSGVSASVPKAVASAFGKKEQPDHGRKFLDLWTLLHGPPLTPEHAFTPDRKWRLDFAHLPSLTAIELHGGIYTHGRHTRGSGFREDRRKMNAAQMAGWVVIELTPEDITGREVERVIELCREREKIRSSVAG